MTDSPTFIWLVQFCKDCRDNGTTTWCDDDSPGECEECGGVPVKYARVEDEGR